MTFDEFIKKYTGVGVDTDGAFGFQWLTPVEKFRFLTSFNRILKVSETAEGDSFVVNLDGGRPSSSRLIPSNPVDPRSVVDPDSSIAKVSRVCADPKISSSVVEGIKVDVINVFTLFGLHKKAMELFDLVVTKSLLYVELISHPTDAPLTSNLFEKKIVSIVQKHVMRAIGLTYDFVAFQSPKFIN